MSERGRSRGKKPEERRAQYRDREILMRESEEGIELRVDGVDIPVARVESTGRYHSYVLTYQEFDSLEELARTAIDHLPMMRREGRGQSPAQGE
ncbi:MAG: hypothetical protein WBW04_10170 [Nitrolancea sp.]